MTRRDGVRIARGCWLPEQFVDDFGARCAAALATCADDTLLSFTTAARIHGVWLPEVADDVHLASAQPARRSTGMTRTQRPEFRAHRHALSAADRDTVNGMPVMSLSRTWLDLARALALPDLVAAGDSVLRAGATEDQLADAVTRGRHLRGIRRAREALPLLDARSRSRPESHLRVAASAPDLPRFQMNEAVYRDTGGWLAEPDLSLPEAKLALEYQGEEHAKVRRMRNDITRGTDLRGEGWLCLAYGPAEVFGQPWQIAPELRMLIRQRAPGLLRPRRRVVSSALSG
jgi:hypothetical protein